MAYSASIRAMTLDELKIGKDAYIESVETPEVSLRKHILDMGLTPGVEVTMIKVAPMGDPMEIRVRGYELTIRKDDARYINLSNVHDMHPISEEEKRDRINAIRHPGVGESMAARKLVKSSSKPLKFALVGNQNCGKTTLFNQLTGSNQHVGNFPGVTVDRKDGIVREHPNMTVTDLPGIYSLSPYTAEEIVTRDFLIKNHPDGIINIIDATNIERNLYLTTELMELGLPMVIALNMMDEVRENGGTIGINALEEALGVPVVPISAAKNEGIDELIEHAMSVGLTGAVPLRYDFCLPGGRDKGAVHRAIHAIIHLIEDHAAAENYPKRFAATAICQDDRAVEDVLGLDENEKEMIEHILTQMEEESGSDRMSAIADMRFTFIETLTQACVVKPHESREHLRSQKADRLLTGKYTAIPFFILIMGLSFYFTFGPIGNGLSWLLEILIGKLTALTDTALTRFGINPVVHSLVIDGIFTGVGSVLSFMPYIVVLFFFLSILEDSGYMARVAFVMDKLLRRLGLSGRSFVPMLIGFGCSVPAIMASRTLPSERDRKMTIMLVPFMSCSAKLPIYAFFSAAFFPQYAALVMIGLYFIGIIVGIIVALISNRFVFRGEPVPFVMELPNYRLPSAKSVLRLMWEKAKDFLTKAFTIIFVATIIIWALQTFDVRLNVVTDPENSLLAMLGGIISPIFRPLGFDDWRISTALITGFTAKESVVSTLYVLLPGGSVESVFTAGSAFVFLVFSLLYTPCVAAVSAVKRELGRGRAAGVVVLQCVIAWIVAFLVKLIFRL